MRADRKRFETWLRQIAAIVDDPWCYEDGMSMNGDAVAFLTLYDALVAAARRATYHEMTAHLLAVMREDAVIDDIAAETAADAD